MIVRHSVAIWHGLRRVRTVSPAPVHRHSGLVTTVQTLASQATSRYTVAFILNKTKAVTLATLCTKSV